MQKILVICPLEKENLLFREGLKHLGLDSVPDKLGSLQIHAVPAIDLLIATGGHGKVQYGIQTQYLLSAAQKVKCVFCVGAGGGLDEAIQVGDLVVAEKTIEHDYIEKFDLSAKKPELPGCPNLMVRAKEVSSSKFKIHYGTIASGDEDIVDPARAAQLMSATRALAVAWEGIGGAKACKFNNVPFLEVRAITDNARDSVAEAFAKNLPLAMSNAAQLISKLI